MTEEENLSDQLEFKQDDGKHKDMVTKSKYASKTEKFLVCLGCLFALLVGLGEPCTFLLFGDIVTDLSVPNAGFAQKIYNRAIWLTVLGFAVLIAATIQYFSLQYSAQQQARRIKQLFFRAVLQQDIAWFDQHSSGTLVTQLSQNIDAIEKGIGQKFGLVLEYISTFIAGIIISFVRSWKLSLIAVATIPFNLLSFGLLAFALKYFTKKEIAAYNEAGSIAGEVLSAIRTVVAFGGEEREHKRYTDKLKLVEKIGIKKEAVIGSSTGILGFVLFASSGVLFWFGIEFFIKGEINPGDVIVVYFTMLIGTISIGVALPSFEFFAAACTAAKDVFDTIERVPPINKSKEGLILNDIKGHIEFRNVSFVYENRPDVPVLKNFNLVIQPGQTVALVGLSGSGKSTAVHLMQRYYDATEGQVFIDGHDIRDLDIKWYRSQLGVVQQEPILFTGTIKDNIKLGKLDASIEEIEESAREANAHEFITRMPNAYDTWVGESGGGMSGGQKQRIAIARALLRNPKILLLDEATSALDTRLENQVQQTLNKARSGRTVIVVAHRLTTVRDADRILVVHHGVIKESGTHDELIELNGIYAKMVQAQEREQTDQEDEVDDRNLDEFDKDERVSVISDVSENDKGQEEKQEEGWVHKHGYAIKRILKISLPHWGYVLGGCIGVIISALTNPGFVLLYSEMFTIFLIYQTNVDEAWRRSKIILGVMFALATAYLIGKIMEGYFFGVVGESLTKTLRSKLFGHMLLQEIGWFDRQENQAGVLTSRLATEATQVRNVSGFQVAILLEGMVLMVSAMVIGFIHCWQITLLMFAFIPFLMIGAYFEHISFYDQNSSPDKKCASHQIAHESFNANRTVTTLGLENYFDEKYIGSLNLNRKKSLRSVIVFSIVTAFSLAIKTFSYACAFPLGAYLIEIGQANSSGVFKAFAAIMISLTSIGRVMAFIPDFIKASESAKRIIATLDRQTLIPKDEGLEPDQPFDGSVEFRNVSFEYPTRPGTRILKKFTHTVQSNKTHALVGESGCGKSTVIQLVLRFYDALGKSKHRGIFVNGHNVKDIRPSWLRRQIGLVSQEPNLFAMTIRENIAYGANYQDVSADEIINAARQANIHDFIMTLPQGYETQVGERGSQISGGQKQRVAIARALLRQPRLLLLDEATAALDNQSERVVQAALDAAMGSRTCLVVAHRLTTIQNADLIVVLDNGHKVECGTSEALMQAKGIYYALHCFGDNGAS